MLGELRVGAGAGAGGGAASMVPVAPHGVLAPLGTHLPSCLVCFEAFSIAADVGPDEPSAAANNFAEFCYAHYRITARRAALGPS